MTTPLGSNPITGPSSLLRTSPPLCPASVLRPSRLPAAWVSPFASGRQVPVFLIEACLKGHAAFMPDVGWAVGRAPPNPCSRDRSPDPGFDVAWYVTTRHQRFTFVRLPETHLTKYFSAFPTTLTTRALYPRSLWRFEACPCRPTPGDLPPSPIKLSQHTTSSHLRVFIKLSALALS